MIIKENFGQVNGEPAHSWRLSSKSGVSIRVTDYGARLTELHVPDREGKTADIVLGFDDAGSYATSTTYFGATVGRYGNRISRGKFNLLGTDYQVDCNEKLNHLHGGRDGWDSRLWSTEVDETKNSITFRTTSEDGEMGFPGRCEIESTYHLDENGLRIVMKVVPSKTTVINMVHHSYYNLAGHSSGNVLQQHMRLPANFYIPVDDELMPTGEILKVSETPFDFRSLRPIGSQLDLLPSTGSEVFEGGAGYDHNWCLDAGSTLLIPAAEIYDPSSGRRLTLSSTEPGVQMYTGGYLNEQTIGKGGNPYCQFAGFTLETQKFPDSPRYIHYPTTTVKAGETYLHEMLLEFSIV